MFTIHRNPNKQQEEQMSIQMNQLNQLSAHSETSIITGNESKELGQTSQTCISHDCCPKCAKKVSKIIYYSCCLGPACKNCYQNMHYFQCPKRNKSINISSNSYNQTQILFENEKKSLNNAYMSNKFFVEKNNGEEQFRCQRCQEKGGQINYYVCKECHNKLLCQNCINITHKTAKFCLHSYKKYQNSSTVKKDKNSLTSQAQLNILTCSLHNKPRTLISQNLQLICSQCNSFSAPFGTNRSKRPKHIDYLSQNSLPLIQEQIQQITTQLNSKYISHKSKWLELQEQLKNEYNKICKLVNQRYEQNLCIIRQVEQSDMKIIQKAVQQSRKAYKQSKIDYKYFGVSKQVMIARLNILFVQLAKLKASAQSNQIIIHRVLGIQAQKLQTLLKGFTVNKIKPKESDDKQNMSIRKSNNFTNNVNHCNLSVSRRSLSKSISKMEHPRNSVMKQNNSSVTKSQNLCQQVCTQPVRNSTPPHFSHHNPLATNNNLMNKQPVTNSQKKSAILRQSSLMNAKIEDITPVVLNFDLKQSTGSRINFISNKPQQQNLTENPHNSGISSNNISQTRNSKKQSDYFQLRDRMRKPNIVNNRFTKR